MEKAVAIIRKVGNQFCVFSKDGTKNLGCSDTREDAVQRLKQIEYFKNKGNLDMTKYEECFNNMSIADMKPDSVNVPSNVPNEVAHRLVDIKTQPKTQSFVGNVGTIAGNPSVRLLDQKDHFPVMTETQARSAMSRAMQLTEVPAWYHGTLDELRYEVYNGITTAHPNIELKVPVAIEKLVIALSDGKDKPETKKSSLINPEDKVKSKVPQEKRPSIASIEFDLPTDEARQAFASDLLTMLEKQKEQLDNAMSVAKRLSKKGISGEEFNGLVSFLQQDILSSMLMKGASATNRRAALLARINKEKK